MVYVIMICALWLLFQGNDSWMDTPTLSPVGSGPAGNEERCKLDLSATMLDRKRGLQGGGV